MADHNQDDQLRETKITSTTLYKGKLLDVFSDQVRLPDGETSEREYIKHQGAAAILPVFENGDVMLIRQYRYPLDQVFLEVPAGKIDPGEDSAKTAVRELNEETGLTCHQNAALGHYYPSIGYTDEIIYLFVGWDIEERAQQVDEEEFIQKQRLAFKDVHEMAVNGEITDSKTALLLLRAAHWWNTNQPFEISW